jgi:alginate O-acetyltransferase complex protein AlgJ
MSVGEGTGRKLPRVLNVGGSLFLIGGTNNVLQLYRPDIYEQVCPLAAWRERLAARATFFREHDLDWRMLLSPEKLSVYGENHLQTVFHDYAMPGDMFIRAVNSSNVLYPRNALVAQGNGSAFTVYPRSDSHWNSTGAFCAFKVFADSIGLNIDPARFADLHPADLIYHGDLWTPQMQSLEPELFRRFKTPDSMRVIYRNELVGYKVDNGLENEPALHVGSHVIVQNCEAQFNRTLILFGSSFSEHRLDCSLLTFVSALYFSTVHFLWSSDLDLTYVARHRPDNVLIEMPERFTTLCPTDTMKIETFGQSQLNAYRNRLTA